MAGGLEVYCKEGKYKFPAHMNSKQQPEDC